MLCTYWARVTRRDLAYLKGKDAELEKPGTYEQQQPGAVPIGSEHHGRRRVAGTVSISSHVRI